MAQAITDVKTFLEDARQAVVELAEFEKQEETLAQEEKKRLRVLGDGAESGGGCREFDREKAPG